MFKNLLLVVIVLSTALISRAAHVNNNVQTKLPLQEIRTIQKCAVFKNSVCPMDLHKDNVRIVSADSNGNVEVWNLNSGQSLFKLPHKEGVPIVVFSEDGNYLATGSYDGIVRVWNTETGSLEKELKGHKQIVFSLAFSSDGKMLASAGADDTAIVWDLNTGAPNIFAKHKGDVWGLSFSPDNNLLLTGGEDNLIYIWDIKTHQLVKTLTDHKGAVLRITFSHDGSIMASGGDDYTVKLWNTLDWKVKQSLTDDSYSIYDLQFSPNDKWLVSGGRDKGLVGEFLQYHFQSQSAENSVSARVWDLDTGAVIQKLSEHSNDIDNIRFTSDGKKLITSGVDGRVVIYNIIDQKVE